MHRIFPGGVFTRRAEGRTYVITSNKDIPTDIAAGRAEFALLGSDQYGELTKPETFCFEPVCELDCGFVFAFPREAVRSRTATMRIATSYPMALAIAAKELEMDVYEPIFRSGKVEGAIEAGYADMIFDIRETGASLTANELIVTVEAEQIVLGGLWKSQSNV